MVRFSASTFGVELRLPGQRSLRVCRPMMVSGVPASECQVRGSCDPEITAATMPPRSPSPRPGKSCSPPKRGGTCRGHQRLKPQRIAISRQEDRSPGRTRPNPGQFCPMADAEHRACRRDPPIGPVPNGCHRRLPRPRHRTLQAAGCNPSQPRFPPRSPDRPGSNAHPACPRDARHAPRSGRRAAGSSSLLMSMNYGPLC